MSEAIIKLKKICPFCAAENELELTESQLKAYDDGNLVQNVFPDKSADWREMFITGICPKCWDSQIVPSEERSRPTGVDPEPGEQPTPNVMPFPPRTSKEAHDITSAVAGLFQKQLEDLYPRMNDSVTNGMAADEKDEYFTKIINEHMASLDERTNWMLRYVAYIHIMESVYDSLHKKALIKKLGEVLLKGDAAIVGLGGKR